MYAFGNCNLYSFLKKGEISKLIDSNAYFQRRFAICINRRQERFVLQHMENTFVDLSSTDDAQLYL